MNVPAPTTDHGVAPRAPSAARRWPLRRWAPLVALLAIAVGCWAARGLLLPPVARWLDVGQPLQRVDYLVVLGGGLDSRPFAAAAMYRRGLADQVVIPTVRLGPDQLDGLIPPEGVATRQVLERLGVPGESIVELLVTVDSTHDEATALRELVAARPGVTVGLLSHEFHTRRLRWVYRNALHDAPCTLMVFGIPVDWCRDTDWWSSAPGLLTYLTEYGKLLATAVQMPG